MLHSEGMKQRDLKKSLLPNLLRDETGEEPSGSSTLVALEGGRFNPFTFVVKALKKKEKIRQFP
jgi:hypothetical protein